MSELDRDLRSGSDVSHASASGEADAGAMM
jgi:hypothetical protein